MSQNSAPKALEEEPLRYLLLHHLRGRITPGEPTLQGQSRRRKLERLRVSASIQPEATGMWRQGASIFIHGEIAPRQVNDLGAVGVFEVELRSQGRQLVRVVALLVHLEVQVKAQLGKQR